MCARGSSSVKLAARTRIGVIATALLVLVAVAVWSYRQLVRPLSLPAKPRTIEEVIDVVGARAERRLRPAFDRAGIPIPPQQLTILALKQEKRLEIYAADHSGGHRFVLSYPILAASGTSGPKLREGDRQVPEGFYRIELLNPNSRHHLSLRVNYPNAADIEQASRDGRDLSVLGGDIMIHGGAESSGCIAIGDPAIEELFVLVARTGLDNVQLIIAPYDFRRRNAPAALESHPVWTVQLHQRLRAEIGRLPL
jgi:L,D-transpeptidase catalytic domain